MRALAVIALGLLLGFQVVRTAAVDASSFPGSLGARLWPSHPSVVLDRAMADIGAAARRGAQPSPPVLRRVAEVARKAPLAPEPFLIAGALSQTRGQASRAEQLFVEARVRDPRSEAARYFLAEHYLRTGRMVEALSEMAVFARLVPSAPAQFAPALAEYALTPGSQPVLRTFFSTAPEFAPLVLFELAADPRNADLILQLGKAREPGATASDPDWRARLVRSLVEQQQFEKALAVWRRLGGIAGGGQTLFNRDFADMAATPPFNWTYGTSGGVAEPAAGGRLRVIYYGRQDTVLAQQTLLLAPGRYRLSMRVTGQVAEAAEIGWSLSCLPQNRSIFTLPIGGAGQIVAPDFAVPAGCRAQRLELTGRGGEMPQSVDFAVSELRLSAAG